MGCYNRSSSGKETRYYRCDRNGNRGQLLSKKCVAPTIPADIVEKLIWQQICEFIESPEVVEEALKTKFNSVTKNWDADIATVEKIIDELREAERRLLRLYADPRNDFSEEALRAELAEIASVREIAGRRKKELEDTKRADDWQKRKIEDSKAVLAKLRAGIQNTSPEMKREIIESLLQEVRVGKSNGGCPSLKIVYAFSEDDHIWPWYNSADRGGLLHEPMPVRLLQRPANNTGFFQLNVALLRLLHQ